MVSRNNVKERLVTDTDRVSHYGIRKLSVGVASVLLGTTLYLGSGAVVHADTVDGNVSQTQVKTDTTVETDNAVKTDTTVKTDNTVKPDNAIKTDTTVKTDNTVKTDTSLKTDNTVKPDNAIKTDTTVKTDNTVKTDTSLKTDNTVKPDNAIKTDTTVKTDNTVKTDTSLKTDNVVKPNNVVKMYMAKNNTVKSAVNGGFDQSTWGTLDVSKWTGQENNGVYELTGYTGNLEHIIVPNSADFAKAGQNVGQVGISADTTHSWFVKGSPESIAFSKTDDQMVKAVGSDWTSAFTGWYDRNGNISFHARTLTLFDGNNLDVSNVMYMPYMFSYDQISDLTPLANWKTENVTNMADMFENNHISDLTPLANWKTENVTNMANMFENNHISDLTPLANWKTENVTDMSYMFNGNQISNLTPLANWKTENVTNMIHMFENNQISDLTPLANWKTENVTNMAEMFRNNQISDLTPLANWKTENVTNMANMFESNQISDLTPLANWKTDSVRAMASMFRYNQISDLTPLANWQTNNVVYMMSMFAYNQIMYADFTKWAFPSASSLHSFINQGTPAIIIVKNADQTLLSSYLVIGTQQNQLHFGSDTVNMPTVYVASDKADARQKILADVKTKLAAYQKSHSSDDIKPVEPLDQLAELVDLANAKFTGANGTLPELDTNDAFALDPVNGLHEHKNVNDNGGYDTDFWGTLDVSKFTTVKNGDNLEITGYTGDAAKVIIPNIADFWVNGLDQGAKQVTISSDVMHDLAKNATRIGLSKTNNQKVVASDAIWQDAFGGMTNSPQTGYNGDGGIWIYNPDLTAMDLHNLDTTNITNMGAMFNGGSNLITVGDLSKWDTLKVTDMGTMFQQASKLTNIGDLSKWDTSNVTDMRGMFNRASSLQDLGDLSKWDTANVTDMSYMFSKASKLQNLGDLSKWNTANVTNMRAMFQSDSGLTNIGDLSKWDTSNVTDMSYMFANATNLTNIGNLDNWNTSKVTDMHWMFGVDSDKQSHLTNIGDLSKWNTGNVTDMNSMFYNATNLTNIGNLDNWNTSKVTNMRWMFGVDSGKQSHLTNIGDLSKWQTGNVTDMSLMFANVANLTNLGDLSKWNTSKVTDMHWMFGGTTNLTNIGNLNNWDTSNVVNMASMFQDATNLTNIGDLSKWQIGNVTNMAYMFTNAINLTNIGDLSKWNTSKVTNMVGMFGDTNALRHLNISNWNLTKLANKNSMQYMFTEDPNLTVIANDLALPVWYQNEINDADYFWNHHIAVITNVPELIKSTGDIDNLKIDNQDASRSIFYDSKGSSNAIQVLKAANQAYIKQYQNEHPGYTLNLVADVDQTDPLSLANAEFTSSKIPQTFKINFVDDANGQIVASSSVEQVLVDTALTLDAKALTKLIPEHYYFTDGNYSIPTSFNYQHVTDNLTIHLTKAPVYTFNLVDDTSNKTVSTFVWDGIDSNYYFTGTVGDLNQKIKQAVNAVEWKNVPAESHHGDVPKSANLLTTVTDLTALPTQDTTQTVHFTHATHPINEAHDVSQVIHYVYQTGSKAGDDYTNHVHFARDGYHDEFDNTDHWNTWTPSATYDFVAVQSPKIQGFTPDIPTVPAAAVNVGDSNIEKVVTYNPDAQKAVVKYIDDTDQMQLSAEDLTGHSNEDSGYNTQATIDKYLGQHYVLVSDDTKGKNVIYDNDDNNDQVYEVHFKHGTKPANESRTKKLIVHYVYAAGQPRSGKAHDDQSAPDIVFSRTGTKDLVTNNIAWNAWDHDDQAFDEIKSPTIDGYTPDQTSIKDVQVDADGLEFTEKTVVYKADSQKLMVNFIDDVTGKTLEKVNKVGQSDESANYNTKSDISKYLAQHYDLVSDDTKGSNLVFDHDDNTDQVHNVHLRHATHQINDQTTKSEVIHYVYADGLARTGQAADDYHAKDLTFTRDGYHDEVTNEDHWNAWTPAQQEFASAKSPEIQGYTADQTEIPVIKVNSVSDNIKRTVTYNADKQRLDVVFIDDTTGDTLSTVTKEGLSDESVNYDTKDDINHYKNLHYNVVSDGTQGQNLVFDHDDGKDQHYEVHLVHATHPIGEQTSTKQTIHYQLADGTKVLDDHTAEVAFSRDGYNDEVTNGNRWNKWTPSDTQTFSNVVSPVKSGYTPDQASVAVVDVHPGDKDIEETVIYSPDKQVMTINYIDDVTGKALSTKQIIGVSDASANYNTKSSINSYVIDHYKLVSDDTKGVDLVFDHDDSIDQVYNVHLMHTYQKVDDHKPVNETVHYVYDNGQTARPDYKAPAINFSRTGTQDLVTSNIVWNAWTPAEQSFDQVATPAISGYTPDVEVVPSVNVSHGSDDVERTVIYHADDQTILVNYIDDDTHSTLKTDAVIGKTAQKSNYTTKKSIDGYIDDHYELVSDDTNDHELVFDSDSTKAQIYNVHLKHTHQNVSDSALVNETIHYIYADGSKARDDHHAPIISFNRTGDKDLVTNAIVWNAWIPTSQNFKAVDSPVIDGYTPSQKTISNITVKPGDKDIDQTVIYAPDTQSIVVNYIDDVTGKTLKTDTLTGKSDRVSDYTTKNNINGYENQHYVLVSDDTHGKTLTFDHDDNRAQIYNVHLSHQTEPASQSRTVNETINYVYADGSKAADTVTAKPLTFTQTGVKDLVTGNIDWNGTWTSKQTFAEVKSPEITGYTASRKVVDPITVDHNSSDIHQTVIYTANNQTAKIKYIDDVTGKTLKTDSANGKFGDQINFGHDVDTQIKAFEGQGYKFKSNSFNGQKYQADNSQNEFDVHFTHGTQNVSRTNKVTETIKYQFADGRQAQKDHVQTANFTQYGVQDLVTKTIGWAPSDPQTFESVTTPELEGYTPDIQNVPAATVNFGDDDITKVVTYKANDQLADIKYIDDTTGKILDTEAASGKFGTKIEFMDDPLSMIQKFEDQGYKLVSDNFTGQDYQADNSKNQFEVHFKHRPKNVTQTSTVTRTIKYVDQKTGNEIHQPVIQTLTFTENGVMDLVTGKTTWTTSSEQQFVKVESPMIDGYENLDISVVDSDTAKFGDGDQTVIVKYQKVETPLASDTPKTTNHSKTSNSLNASVTLANTISKVAQSTQAESQNTSIRSSQTSTQYAGNNDAHANQLPQTGNKNDHQLELFGLIGIAFAGLTGLFGFGTRRKKRD